jgi:hypothetical protein
MARRVLEPREKPMMSVAEQKDDFLLTCYLVFRERVAAYSRSQNLAELWANRERLEVAVQQLALALADQQGEPQPPCRLVDDADADYGPGSTRPGHPHLARLPRGFQEV